MPSSPIVGVIRFVRTLFLFTYTDFKTVLLPVSAFASIAAPASSLFNSAVAVIWIWVHLLHCNISNQNNSAAEDCINHPWRPIPAGLISETNARILRWAVVALCLCFSSAFGLLALLTSILITATAVLYNDLNFAGHWATKNVCCFSGYLFFEVGAVAIMGRTQHLDAIALRALVSSGIVILSTVHVQDFPDVEGDSALNRVTFPIVAPVTSRVLTAIMIPFWSVCTAFIWGIGMWTSLGFICMGFIIAWRIYFLRTMPEDKRSYVAYNAWLTMLHLLPANARWSIFSP